MSTIKSAGHVVQSHLEGRFHDQDPIFYSSLVEQQLRARFGEVEGRLVHMVRNSKEDAVVGGLALVQTLKGAYRIWRAERKGLNRTKVLRAADRRIVVLEDVQ